jgi:Transglutaminase-like superfamily
MRRRRAAQEDTHRSGWRPMARPLRLLFRLASPDGRHALHGLLLLLEVDARLRLTGFSRLEKALRLPPGAEAVPGETEAHLQEARSMARALYRASRWIPQARCLHRALALLLWLRRRGIAADLRMGVRSARETLQGHAWVEWHGTPLDEDRSVCDAYSPLQRCEVRWLTDRPQSD